MKPKQQLKFNHYTDKTLTPIQRSSIIILHLQGYDVNYISKRKLQSKDTNDIINNARRTKFTTPNKLRNELKLNVSARTIRRTLNENKILGHIARKEYPFGRDHIRKRLSFANGYAQRTNWNDVLFSDEKSFPLCKSTSQQWVQIPEGESPFQPEYMVHKKSHSEKVHMWACFAAGGVGEFKLFEQNMDKKIFKRILMKHLKSSATKLFGDNHWWFYMDNDPKHTSGVIQNWLFHNGIQLIDVPPYSGDLNPMENLWSDMNRRVESRFSQTIDELKTVITDEWKQTSAILLSKLVASMPARCKAVVNNHGHITNY